jgi:GxxExxY protein
MLENKIAILIVDAAYHVHRKLGPGLLESVYEIVLAYELENRGLSIKRQYPIPIIPFSILMFRNKEWGIRG